jgi:hypothetical protein
MLADGGSALLRELEVDIIKRQSLWCASVVMRITGDRHEAR